MSKIKSAVGSILLTGSLWSLQMLPNPDDPQFTNRTYVFSDQFIKFISDNTFAIGFVIMGLSIFFTILNVSLALKSARKKYLKKYLEHVIKEDFGGRFDNTRITIFEVKKGYCYFITYVYRSFFRCFSSHWSNNLLWIHCKNSPQLTKKYLTIYARCSTPHEDGSSTFFPIPNERNKVFGIASMSYLSKKQEKVETVNISQIIKFDKEYVNYSTDEQSQIKKYMQANYMIIDNDTQKSYNRLRCIHRFSNHLYAEVIYDKNEDVWGVFVVDIENDSEERIFTENKCKSMSKTIKAITIFLNHIK